MKIFWLISLLVVVGCSGVQVRPDIVNHPTRPDLSCLSPEFFKETIETAQGCMGGKVDLEDYRIITSPSPLEGYQCVADTFLAEIVVKLESCTKQ